MAISKLILNGEVQMDVTSDTVTAGSMLSGTTATKNDGTKATGTIASKSSSDLTASGATVTAPAGYYSTAATKSIGAGSAFPPAVTITKAPTIGVNASGVVTASYNGSSSITPTVTSGYVSQGTAGTISTTGTSTYQLTSLAATTYYPSTADQTIASQRWLVGNQTIKSVTTSNLTAENIAEGVVVKVGDSDNASRITQITGTHSGKTKYTATIVGTGSTSTTSARYAVYNSTNYFTDGETFTFAAGDSVILRALRRSNYSYIKINGEVVATGNDSLVSYRYTLPSCDVVIYLTTTGEVNLVVATIDITENGTYEVDEYGYANVNVDGGETYTFTESYKAGSVNFSVKINNVLQSFPFTFHGGEVVDLSCSDTGAYGYPIYIDGVQVAASSLTPIHYTWTLPKCNIDVSVDGDGAHIVTDAERLSITENGTYFVDDYNYADVNVGAGGGFTADQIATRTISGDISGNATSIGSYAFYQCTSLNTVSFPSCSYIGNYAFTSCHNLTTVNFPSCTSIGGSAFAYCSSLTMASFPLCTTISSYAFASCHNLTTVSFSSCTSIGGSAFGWCYSLNTVSFPSCTYISSYAFRSCGLITVNFPQCSMIGSYAFAYCSRITTVSFPLCRSIYNYAFIDCSGLTTVNFPSCTSIGGSAFIRCGNLTTASFPSCTTIYGSAFNGCYNLLSLYLLGSSVPSLVYLTAFDSTPIAGYTTSTGGVYGSIFVPSSLYDSYLTATNWSLYSERIVSV